MTLTICIIAKDGIVLASDSRESATLTANDTVKKIFKLDDHNAMGIAGDGRLAGHFFDVISPQLNFRGGVSNLAEQLRKLGKATFNDFFSHLEPDKRPSLTILLSGYTPENTPAVYQLSSNDNFVPRKSVTGFDCIGIPIIAEYIMNRVYEPEVSYIHAAEMAAFCIKETGSQARRVGGPTQIATFSNTKAYAELTAEEVSRIEEKCEKIGLAQKGNFYPEEVESGSTTTKEAEKEEIGS